MTVLFVVVRQGSKSLVDFLDSGFRQRQITALVADGKVVRMPVFYQATISVFQVTEAAARLDPKDTIVLQVVSIHMLLVAANQAGPDRLILRPSRL